MGAEQSTPSENVSGPADEEALKQPREPKALVVVGPSGGLRDHMCCQNVWGKGHLLLHSADGLWRDTDRAVRGVRSYWKRMVPGWTSHADTGMTTVALTAARRTGRGWQGHLDSQAAGKRAR